MCLGIPGQVIEFVDETHQIAQVEVNGVGRKVNVGLVLPDGLKTGDWVLVHTGFALNILDEAEAKDTLQFLRGLGESYEEELR